ncbi:MAG: ribosome small subunit-dependent GTPase A [Lachnospirales bacterium]
MKGRIVKGVGGLYTIDTAEGIYTGNPRGIFRLENIKPLIGDFVEIEITHEQDRECAINEIYPRKNEMIRPSVSNIDQVFIVFSIKNPKINFDLLDRFIILAESKKMEITLCFNKLDLSKEKDTEDLKKIYGDLYNIIFLSTYNAIGLDKIKEYSKNKVSVFAGPSGVGKSSIINYILPEANMEIGEISKKIKRGKHTTRHVELHSIDKNSYIIDSPGFTSLNFENIDIYNLKDYFVEFRNYDNCQFRDCMHNKEVDCAIKNEVGKNISKKRYYRYLQFLEMLEKGK